MFASRSTVINHANIGSHSMTPHSKALYLFVISKNNINILREEKGVRHKQLIKLPEKSFLNGSSYISSCISFILENLLVKKLGTKLCNYLPCSLAANASYYQQTLQTLYR